MNRLRKNYFLADRWLNRVVEKYHSNYRFFITSVVWRAGGRRRIIYRSPTISQLLRQFLGTWTALTSVFDVGGTHLGCPPQCTLLPFRHNHHRTRRVRDDAADELPESIRQKLKLEYEEGPKRYAERWEKGAVRHGPTIGAQRRA